MAINISKNELNKFLKRKKGDNSNSKTLDIVEKKKNNPLKNAINLLKDFETNDKIYFNSDSTKCMLEFENISFLSLNISLRLGALKIEKYKSLWKTRVEKLVTKQALERWGDSSNNKILIEFLYESKTASFLDYDSLIASFKPALDGIESDKMIKDDSQKYVPLILARQHKSPDGIPRLKVMLSYIKEIDSFFSEDFLKATKIK